MIPHGDTIRFIYRSENIQVSMVTSNSRLISNKNNITIPRAELRGLSLMDELLLSVYHALKSIFVFQKTYFWIDSSVIFY